MAARVKVSQKYRVSVPSAARKKLHIEKGDHLLVDVRDGYIVLMREPQDYSRHLRGLHRQIWENVEPQEYVRKEREDWQG
ncbi:MAG: AbrB/MazE/SpoVT family DNA-binding domain-containing protein [Chloroflexi bacterium]|nr:AbrB/MazE/SpoVT family DNA-binding domain-containing protein [Chloroflexota bacterium]MDA8188028.1 AbrB/MazE/SpoVT family DNA-binding domain-containing protein [Dehalococcoidales bacterium]